MDVYTNPHDVNDTVMADAAETLTILTYREHRAELQSMGMWDVFVSAIRTMPRGVLAKLVNVDGMLGLEVRSDNS